MTTLTDLESEALLTEKQAAEVLSFSQRALQRWRSTGDGPVYVKVSARAIRYTRQSIKEFINNRLRVSTKSASPLSNPTKK